MSATDAKEAVRPPDTGEGADLGDGTDLRPDASYDAATIERRWQERWRATDAFALDRAEPSNGSTYVFTACPFTSGIAHIGHVRSYTISDAHARYRRARGESVLFTLGFDAFGLPSELGAIKNREAPRRWVRRCEAKMRRQFDRLGYSFDWSRTFVTCDPSVYKWTQWLFLKLLAHDLVYRATGVVDWCEQCETVVANMQIEEGRCWRCHEPVQLRSMAQWFLRVEAFSEENNRLVNTLEGWNKLARGTQRHVSGEVHGAELNAYGPDGASLGVFTAHPENVNAADMVLISPNHPEAERWAETCAAPSEIAQLGSAAWRQVVDEAQTLPCVDTGLRVRLADTDIWLPLVFSASVDPRCGPSAMLGTSAIDPIDATIAHTLGLSSEARTEEIPRSALRPARRSSIRDFAISRQRSWGTPIPVVVCEDCGRIPLPLSSLPLLLPDMVAGEEDYGLAANPSFYECECPQCGAGARRETDTLDCHFDGMWFWLVPCISAAERDASMFDDEELGRWLPVEQVIWGADGGSMIYDIRILAKALRDIGYIVHAEGEPYKNVLMHEMVRADGRKMSKHLNNAVSPERLVAQYGADAVRLAVLMAAAPARTFSWDTGLLRHTRGFIERLWLFGTMYLHEDLSPAAPGGPEDPLRRRLAGWCATARGRITEDLERLEPHRAVQNAIFLLKRIEDFESKAIARRKALALEDEAALSRAVELLVRLIAPMSPHVAEELWTLTGSQKLLAEMPWPAEVELRG